MISKTQISLKEAIKKTQHRLQHSKIPTLVSKTPTQVFSLNITKILRTVFLREHLWWPLLPIVVQVFLPVCLVRFSFLNSCMLAASTSLNTVSL